MPDISTQLRTYFDETVERVTEEDVRIRATTERGIPIPSPRFRPRPLAAGAIGFGLAMTLLGVVMVVDRVFGSELADVGGNGGPGAVTTGEPGTAWLFIPLVFGLGLLGTGIIWARRRNGDMRERGEGSMQTIEKAEPVEAPVGNEILSLKKRNRWLGWLAGILAVAVVGLGVWLMAELGGGSSDTAVTPEIEQLLTDYSTTWSNADGAAYLALLTDDYVIETARYGTLTGPQQASNLEPGTSGVETISEYTMIGTGPWYVTMASHHDSTPPYGVAVDSVSVVKIVDEGGTLKVAYHKAFGEAFE
jgi:hypothetical protein